MKSQRIPKVIKTHSEGNLSESNVLRLFTQKDMPNSWWHYRKKSGDLQSQWIQPVVVEISLTKWSGLTNRVTARSELSCTMWVGFVRVVSPYLVLQCGGHHSRICATHIAQRLRSGSDKPPAQQTDCLTDASTSLVALEWQKRKFHLFYRQQSLCGGEKNQQLSPTLSIKMNL